MLENIIAVAVIIVFALYFNYSISLIDFIFDKMLLDQLSLWEVISKLNLFRKIMLVLSLPIAIPFGLILLVIKLVFYLRVQK